MSCLVFRKRYWFYLLIPLILSVPSHAQIAAEVSSKSELTSTTLVNALIGSTKVVKITMRGSIIQGISPSAITSPVQITVGGDGETEIRIKSSQGDVIEQYSAPGTAESCHITGKD